MPGSATRTILAGGLFSLAFACAAQISPARTHMLMVAAANDQDNGSATTTNSPTLPPAWIEQQMQKREQYQRQLQQRLADPEQRAQLHAEKLLQARASRPDLARLLHLDPSAEAKLLGLLADQDLAMELRPNDFANFDFGPNHDIAPFVLDYTSRMHELSELLGPKVLDDFIDYQISQQERRDVELFQDALPATAKLSNEQKDRMVSTLFEDHLRRQEQAELRLFSSSDIAEILNSPAEESEGRLAIRNITIEEANMLHEQQEQYEVLERLRPILTPEQSRVFAARQQEAVDVRVARTQEQRRKLGLDLSKALQERLPPAAPLPAPTRDVQLKLELAINNWKLNPTATSVRGAAVTFQGPDGLSLEARPLLVGPDNLTVQLKFYESVGKTRRLLGQTLGGVGGAVLLGRVGFQVSFKSEARYL